MDPRQLYKSDMHNADLSYDFSSATSTLSEFFSYPTMFNIGRSPNSPLSSKPDSETLSPLSNSLEQHSSTEAPSSGKSPSRNSPLQSINSFTPPLDHQDSFQASSRMISEMSVLQELESLLMSPDTYEVATNACADSEPSKSRPRSWTSEPQYDSSLSYDYGGCKFQKVSHGPSAERQLVLPRDASRFGIKGLLVECARAIAENRLADFEILVEQAWGSVSVNGEPLKRLGAYMLEGLVARKEASGTAIYRALRCREPEGSELLTHMHTLYDICPYFKFGYMAANGAIAEAVRNEERVHIIDFQIAQGTQWITLIQALAAAPGGPPSVRITGVDDPVSRYARGGGLEAVGRKLTAIAKKFNIPFEFYELPVFGPEVTRDMLDIRPGEALAVNFTLQLHHTPDESVDVSNPRDGLLRMVKGLSPKVTTLVEQESNTNTTPFLTRFMETLDYYYAMFESIDVTLPRDDKKRINVEQHCLAKDIVNIIACEGKERLERHELLGKWRSRLSMAGFKPCPLSSYVNSVIRSLLKSYSDNYTLVEKDGAMLLGWKDRNLISASAWH